MEKSFDFGALLQNHEKKHKNKPLQFSTMSAGVRKRLESNIKVRKSNRLSNFDSIRNLPKYDTPLKEQDPLTKEQQRRLQLEKWKEEKQKKKKEAAALKKKPFITGVAHASLTFVPPPPITKAVPSSSGRVTRSQSARTRSDKPNPSKTTTKQNKTESFAPKNATFKAPDMKNMDKLPTLVPVSKIKSREIITFDPILPVKIQVSSKNKRKPEPTIHENNRNMRDKGRSQVEGRPRRGQARYVKLASPSSTQSHTRESQSKVKTSTKHAQSSSDEKTSPVSEHPKSKPKILRKSVPSSEGSTSPTLQESLQKQKTPRKSVVSNKTSTPKNPIPKSESSSEERLRSPKSPENIPLTPEQRVEKAKKISPFVTLSRGKANARRETKQKMEDGLFDEDASDIDSVALFKRQLNSEIKRITEMCETWDKISEQIVLPETVQEAVLGAVGQARLLMSRKLQQFAELVARCERPDPAQPLVTPADLHGFWDMVFMQIVNVDLRFKKLEEMRARNWAEEAPVAPPRKAPPRAKPQAKPAAASRLRDVIAAARRAKKQDQAGSEAAAECQGPAAEPEPAKTFEAGFFCVRSPVRSPAAATPPRAPPSLLKAVLSNEANKSASKNRTSLAMMRASLNAKNVGNDSSLVEPLVPLTPINLHATPGRSILKPLNVPSAKKSIKVVLFDDSDVETHDTSLNNAANVNDVSVVGRLEDEPTGVSTIDVEKERELKENKSKKKSLVRQDAIEEKSPIMTRSRRKTIDSITASEDIVEKTPKRSSRRKKALQEVEVNVMDEKTYTPKRSARRRITQSNVA